MHCMVKDNSNLKKLQEMNYPEASLWVSKAVSRQDSLYEASFGEWTRGAFNAYNLLIEFL
jgi:hypothetical protein